MLSCMQESSQPDAEFYAKVEAKKRRLWKRLYTDLNRQAVVDCLVPFASMMFPQWSLLSFHQDTCEAFVCHRAIDDLYTLAEMECNLWQARNIVQLLDESTADFRQVSSWI